MNSEKRGSEKLMNGCTGLSTLSQQELEQVAGGAYLSAFPVVNITPTRIYKVFPYGIIDPEVLNLDQLGGLTMGY